MKAEAIMCKRRGMERENCSTNGNAINNDTNVTQSSRDTNIGYEPILNCLKDYWEQVIGSFTGVFLTFLILKSQAEGRYYHLPTKYFLDDRLALTIKFAIVSIFILIIVWPIIKKMNRNDSYITFIESISSITFLFLFIFGLLFYVYFSYGLNNIRINQYLYRYILVCSILIFITILVHTWNYLKANNMDICIYLVYIVIAFLVFFVLFFKLKIDIIYALLFENIIFTILSITIIKIVYILSQNLCLFMRNIWSYITEIFIVRDQVNFNKKISIIFFRLISKIPIILFKIILFSIKFIKSLFEEYIVLGLVIFSFFILIIFKSYYIENLIISSKQQYEIIDMSDSKCEKYKAVITEYGDFLVVMDCEIKEKVLYIYCNNYETIEKANNGIVIFDKNLSDKYKYNEVKVEVNSE